MSGKIKYLQVNDMTELENQIRELKGETTIYKGSLNKIAYGSDKISKHIAKEALDMGEI